MNKEEEERIMNIVCVHRNDHELFVSWLCRSHVYRCHEQSLCVSMYLV